MYTRAYLHGVPRVENRHVQLHLVGTTLARQSDFLEGVCDHVAHFLQPEFTVLLQVGRLQRIPLLVGEYLPVKHSHGTDLFVTKVAQ